MDIKPPRNAKEYERASIELKMNAAPATYSCQKCSWPVLSGFCCSYCGGDNPSERKDGKRVKEYEWLE